MVRVVGRAHRIATHTLAARESASCVLVRDAREIQIDHRRADREGDNRNVTDHADEKIGRLPLPRNDGAKSVSAITVSRRAQAP